MRTTRLCFAATLTLLALGGGLQPAMAAEGARCSATFVIILDPGFSAEPSTGTHRSEAPGVLNCDGAVNGSPITGAGTLTDEGPYGTDDPDTCADGSEGTGIDRLTVPTRDGQQEIESRLQLHRREEVERRALPRGVQGHPVHRNIQSRLPQTGFADGHIVALEQFPHALAQVEVIFN